MAALSFLAGMAAGYVLGAKAGTQRYHQIKDLSTRVWNSQPVQTQVSSAKEVARTKAAPVVADLVADAARATGEKLRQSRTVTSEISEGRVEDESHDGATVTPLTQPGTPAGDVWADAASTKDAVGE